MADSSRGGSSTPPVYGQQRQFQSHGQGQVQYQGQNQGQGVGQQGLGYQPRAQKGQMQV